MGRTTEESIKLIQESDADSFEVFTETDHKTFLENHLSAEVEKHRAEDAGNLHRKYEEDIFDLTGKKKKSGQKAYNFLKEVIQDLQSESTGNSDLQAEIEKLKGQIKDGDGAEALKKDLDKVVADYQAD